MWYVFDGKEFYDSFMKLKVAVKYARFLARTLPSVKVKFMSEEQFKNYCTPTFNIVL